MIIDTYYKGVIGLSVSNLGVSESWEGLMKIATDLKIDDEELNGSLFILMEILEGNDFPKQREIMNIN